MIIERKREISDILHEYWGKNADLVMINAEIEKKYILFDEFLDHCVACGGNWGGMLLSGMKELYPKTWEAIPDDMGVNAWLCICMILELLDVDYSKKA